MKNIYYSIVIPTHNRPHLISKVIEGFKYLKNSEIIIVENNSTKENKEKYKNINFPANVKLLHKDNITLLEARKIGLDHAEGKYIFNIDDDDLVLPKFINFLNKNAWNLQEDVYRFSFKKFGYGGNPSVFYKKIKIKSLFKFQQFSTFLLKKESIKSLPLWNKLFMLEDNYFAFRLFEYIPNQIFINIKTIHFNYFKEKKSMTRSKMNIEDFYPIINYSKTMKYYDLLMHTVLRMVIQNKKNIFKNKMDYYDFLSKYLKNTKYSKDFIFEYKVWFLWLKLTKRKFFKNKK